MEFLIVCTANVCRSPMAAAFARARLNGSDTVVRTAGVLPGERVVDPVAVEVLAGFGLAADDRWSQPLSAAEIQRADLVLCLERRHLREVVILDREALAKSFTLRELVRRGDVVGPRPPDTSLPAWLAAVGANRDPASLLADAPDDDVADPTGGPLAGYQHTARWLESLVGRVLTLVAPSAGAGGEDDDQQVDHPTPDPGEPVVSPSEDAELQRWHHRDTSGADRVVGLIADRSGMRLARNVTGTLRARGFELLPPASDRWVATSWATCARLAADTVATGAVHVAIVLTDSSIGPAVLANRVQKVRAVAPGDVSTARRARGRFGANVLCLGVREVTASEAEELVAAFLNTLPSSPAELRPFD